MQEVAEKIELNIDGQTVVVERLKDGTFRKPDYLTGAEREVVGEQIRPDGTTRNKDIGGATGATFPKGVNTNGAMGNITAPATAAAAEWDGWGTALKPSHEPIIVAMKPLDGTFAENAQRHGVAGLWIDGGRVGTEDNLGGGAYSGNTEKLVNEVYGEYKKLKPHQFEQPKGRWPANVVHDGSPEVLAGFPETGASRAADRGLQSDIRGNNYNRSQGKRLPGSKSIRGHTDNGGSAARFFYCAKSSRSERNAGLGGMEAQQRDASRHADQPSMNGGDGNPYNRGAKPVTNHHPTVKPLDLLRWLCRLTKTPAGGVVLDPYLGSGTTAMAAVLEGRDYIGIEREPEYVEIAKRRVAWAEEQRAIEEMQPALPGLSKPATPTYTQQELL